MHSGLHSMGATDSLQYLVDFLVRYFPALTQKEKG